MSENGPNNNRGKSKIVHSLLCRHAIIEVRFLTERDIPSLGVRTGGWVEVDVSAVVAVVAVAVVALGL